MLELRKMSEKSNEHRHGEDTDPSSSKTNYLKWSMMKAHILGH